MDTNINYGIDLGTTNSALARFIKGEVQIFNNPSDYGRSTLPSVVGFKKDKITVGTKAKEMMERDPRSVVGAFKRRMGTSESYKIKTIGQSMTPVDLSAMILKELKTFLPAGDTLSAAVITIPASFDTLQSNATKEAGRLAGLEQVVLLQEPIAASLAYANMKKERELPDGQWLVYDFGGGTFDVALVRIHQGEMRVLDHEGDNFLGGTDFDRLIVEQILIPKLNTQFSFADLEDQLKSEKGRFNTQYHVMLRRAEEAKIQLSTKTSAEVVVDGMTDDDDNEIDVELVVTRSEFNELIKPAVDSTVAMVKTILTRNNFQASDLLFTLMVGGSTYIPFVRQRVEESLGTPVNCDIDPTTAVAVGAAYYASGKRREKPQSEASIQGASRLSIKTTYQKTSREPDELFSARITGDVTGLSYRITRGDGGFDTGIKALSERINEDLPLVADTYNMFRLAIYDAQNNLVANDAEEIAINSGFSISGQPLPQDICLEVDDEDHPGNTRLLCVFQRMTPLPARRTLSFPLNKTVIKGADGESILINVLEGPQTSLAEANKLIGHLGILSSNLRRDVQRGSEIEITLEMTESRDLAITAYLTMIDQEFKQVFTPKVRATSVALVQREAKDLNQKIGSEIEAAEEREDYETAGVLKKLRKEAGDLGTEAGELTRDDVTDKKYQLEDRKRRLAQQLHDATRERRIAEIRAEYQEEKELCHSLIEEHGNDQERKYLRDVEMQEPALLGSDNATRIQELTDRLLSIRVGILWRLPAYLTRLFSNLEQQSTRMNNQDQAAILIQGGRKYIQAQDWSQLRTVNQELMNLLPREIQETVSKKIGF